MFFNRRTGLGQDENLQLIRRRMYFGILLFVVGGLIALLFALLLLRDKNGTLIVTADQPDAVIVLNGSVTETRVGTPIEGLRPDTYTVSVALSGYRPQPARLVVRVSAGKTAEAVFNLIPESPPKPAETASTSEKPRTKVSEKSPPAETPPRKPNTEAKSEPSGQKAEAVTSSSRETVYGTLKVTTSPVEGAIYVDDRFMGMGKLTLTDIALGEVVVRFGEVEGYRTPDPEKAFLTPDWPFANIKGIYLPLIYISAYIDASGRAVNKKCTIHTGYIWKGSPVYDDPVAGPIVKFLEEINAFAWEIGYAFSNRNPPGEDFLEISFNLPENFDGNKPLELHLYGYASDRKYPFAISGKTAVDIIVNDKKVKEGFHPGITLSENSPPQPDVFPVNAFLKVGENRIRIQASPSSRCYYFLQQIVLL